MEQYSGWGWTLQQWLAADHRQRLLALSQVVAHLQEEDPVWISILPVDRLPEALAAADPMAPLYGIPFAVKDNIDAAGWYTTAGCPAFATLAEHDATAVAQLRAAGAILVGKTNMDQFATGLVGVRSPYGVPENPFDSTAIPGGSSSGSAVAVSRGWVPLALGTDTAGSGRVPAACCNVVGLKPSLGRMSTQGVVPACRSLDCVSIFAHTVGDAWTALQCCQGFDPQDPYSRPIGDEGAVARIPQRLGIPDSPEWFGDAAAAAAWEDALEQWQALGVELIPISFASMRELAQLLYEGAWVAERRAAVGDFFVSNAEDIHPVVRGIIAGGDAHSAVDAFTCEYRRQALKRAIHGHFSQVDAFLVPTAPRFPSVAQVEADPVGVNAQMGTWTNFVNLADCCALAVPAGLRSDGLPAGVTLIAPAWHDAAIAELGRRWCQRLAPPLGATGLPYVDPCEDICTPAPCLSLAVVGAHLSGQPLNYQLTDRGATLRNSTTTSPHYHLYALPDSNPAKPGLCRSSSGGHPISVEIWDMDAVSFAEIVAAIPAPLGIGSIELADGSWVQGFLCEAWALEQAKDISAAGGWREWLSQQQPS